MSELFDEAKIREALSLLIAPGSVFEIRALDAKLSGNYRTGIISGYFEGADACVRELEKLTAAKGIYITLNPVNAALLARRANRLDLADKNALTGDQHIVRRCWLLIDVDPDRPSGQCNRRGESSCQEESAKIYRFLKSAGGLSLS